ncbi:MAG: hypothetical protein ABSB76_10990, partial [Streptosporangiaceae bacterium]
VPPWCRRGAAVVPPWCRRLSACWGGFASMGDVAAVRPAVRAPDTRLVSVVLLVAILVSAASAVRYPCRTGTK